MLLALANATQDVFDRRVRRYIGGALLLGVGVFVGVWFGIDALLRAWAGGDGALPGALSWLGAAATSAWKGNEAAVRNPRTPTAGLPPPAIPFVAASPRATRLGRSTRNLLLKADPTPTATS